MLGPPHESQDDTPVKRRRPTLQARASPQAGVTPPGLRNTGGPSQAVAFAHTRLQLAILLHAQQRDELGLLHSDVFTGIGSWHEVASEVGIPTTNACELQPAQRQRLSQQWSNANVTSDFRKTRFTSWPPSKHQRLWGTTSPACPGLTVSGKGALRHWADIRNDKSIMCPAMFRAMGASIACIEQVSEVVTLDASHSMLTSLYSTAVQNGYMPLGAPLYMHSQFGGGTSSKDRQLGVSQMGRDL